MDHRFQVIEVVKAQVFTAMPDGFRRKGATPGPSDRGGLEAECFLEGPCFDRPAQLRLVDNPLRGNGCQYRCKTLCASIGLLGSGYCLGV
jgi:hypothetical protein